MADQFDFTPKVNPLQGVSLADMVAAQQPALTSFLQAASPALQALRQRQQRAQQMEALQAMNQPGVGQGSASISPEQMIALAPLMGQRVFQMGAGQAPQRALDFQKEQAQTADIMAQVEQRLGGGGGIGNLTQEQKDNLAWGMQNRLVAPKQMTYRGPKAEILSNMLGEMRNGKRPTQSLIGLDAYMAGETSKESATGKLRGGKAEEVAAMAGTVEDALDAVEPMLKNLSPTSLTRLNAAYASGLANIANDPDANAVLGMLGEATALQATVLHGGGSPTDEDMKLARSYIRPGLTQGGFSGVKKAVKVVNTSRVRRLKGLESNIPEPLNQKVKPSSAHDALLDKYGVP